MWSALQKWHKKIEAEIAEVEEVELVLQSAKEKEGIGDCNRCP